MPALVFPSADALRRALAGGVVPAAVAATPARGGTDPDGRAWVEPPVALPREVVAGLARLGAQLVANPLSAGEAIRSWAELLPLTSARVELTSHVLLELPAADLARLARELRRRDVPPPGVRLLDGDGPGRAWLLAPGLPPDLLGAKVGAEAFTEAAPGVWVSAGWDHPLPELLNPPTEGCLLVRPPRSVTAFAEPPPRAEPREYPIAGRPAVRPSVTPPSITVPVRLVPGAPPGREALWVWPAGEDGPFREFCRTADQRTLRGLDVAFVGSGTDARVVLRRAAGREGAPVPVADRGFVPHPRAAGLFLPAGYDLRPPVRAAVLGRLFDLGADRVVWVEPAAGGRFVRLAVPSTAFRPLAGTVRYVVPVAAPLAGGLAPADPFALAPLPPVVADPLPETIPAEPAMTLPTSQEPRSGWLTRLVRRISRAGSHTPEPQPPKPRKDRPATTPRREPAAAEAVVHGPDRLARRHALEARLVDDYPRLGPADRAARWADLAAAYGAVGAADDAAVCWLNAVWESDATPGPLFGRWYEAECRAAGVRPDRFDPNGPARVTAANACRGTPDVAPGRLRAALDRGFDDLPVRAGWLAALSLARLGGGDPLGLARWRDRVLTRLADGSPGLDLDAPSFLRFHGAPDPERFRAARGWLVKARRPVLGWVGRLRNPGRLQWAGLDPEADCTAAYALLLLAWGLAALGDRARAKDWAGRACRVLHRANRPGADPAVHAVLSDALVARLRDAQDGRPPRPGLPPDLVRRYDALPEFGRYAVDKFRRFSRVLEPADRVRDYGGREFGGLWGTDRLADRLALLAGSAEPVISPDEVRGLLAEAPADPRVVFALLEVAPRLDPSVLPDVLAAVVPALGEVGRWVGTGRPAGEAAALRPAVLARLVDNALTAAARA
ncbi:MAG: hypothetical protein K2X82_27320, partial [Gemmataceae bacterium]|nr:hypothetical protein [Gemmataceae bacterium]